MDGQTNTASPICVHTEKEREDTRLSQQINAKKKKIIILGDQQGQSSIKNQCSGGMRCFHDQHQHGE